MLLRHSLTKLFKSNGVHEKDRRLKFVIEIIKVVHKSQLLGRTSCLGSKSDFSTYVCIYNDYCNISIYKKGNVNLCLESTS